MGEPGPRVPLNRHGSISQNGVTPDSPPGKELVNAGKAGCYYASSPQDSDVYISTCCGTACQNASINSTELLADLHSTGRGRAQYVKPTRLNIHQEVTAIQEPSEPSEPSHPESGAPGGKPGSVAARASAVMQRWLYQLNPPAASPSCSFHASEPYSEAGRQIVVTSSEHCPDASLPCMIQINDQTTVSTTATSSTTQTALGLR
jgi:hypothetical protein